MASGIDRPARVRTRRAARVKRPSTGYAIMADANLAAPYHINSGE
ncbi:MAG TPA: hypothetical protein VFB21_13725 [Chthonomonadaceae bacterium]|nr:hypothetical protein [Chthonomonadaceae bacterium]